MIVIIDYKIGNVGSILNMLKNIGADAIISSDIGQIKNAEKLILPGVGSFDNGMKNLKAMGFISEFEKKVLKEKTPILGICLGMQLFARKSEEGVLNGLGWIGGEVKKFKLDSSFKIPHMGWNNIDICKKDPLFKDMEDEIKFYFVHSYHFACESQDDILATVNYGYDFPSIIKKENIIGVQFHPEKSHKYGMKLLKNFIELC